MGVSTSTGEYHDSMFDYYASKFQQPIISSSEENKRTSDAPKGSDGPSIDNEHHVPLAASALMDAEGNYAGLAVDHRIKDSDLGHKGFSAFEAVSRHEAIELSHMKNLIAGGMKPQEAYEEAHDKIATPLETAYVRAQGGDALLEKYKQFWRDGASIAKEPTDRERHPDAHTTKFKLDERSLYKHGRERLKDPNVPAYDKENLDKENIYVPGSGSMPHRWLDKRDVRVD